MSYRDYKYHPEGLSGKGFGKRGKYCACGCEEWFFSSSLNNQKYIPGHEPEKEFRTCICGCEQTFECLVSSEKQCIVHHHSPLKITDYCSCKYQSKKNNSYISFQSSFELVFILNCELDKNITSYGNCKFCIHYDHKGKIRRYFPDFFTKDASGNTNIVEIKPDYFLNEEKNLCKFKALREYCLDNGMEYDILTETSLKALEDANINQEDIAFSKEKDIEKLKKANILISKNSTIKGIK